MKLKIFVDTNVFLDSVLNRWDEEKIKAISVIFKSLENNKITGLVSDATIFTIIYILQRNKIPKKELQAFITTIAHYLTIIGATNDTIQKAMTNDYNFEDLEDAILHQLAIENWADYIITSNTKDFTNSKIPVLQPEEFVKNFLSS